MRREGEFSSIEINTEGRRERPVLSLTLRLHWLYKSSKLETAVSVVHWCSLTGRLLWRSLKHPMAPLAGILHEKIKIKSCSVKPQEEGTLCLWLIGSSRYKLQETNWLSKWAMPLVCTYVIVVNNQWRDSSSGSANPCWVGGGRVRLSISYAESLRVRKKRRLVKRREDSPQEEADLSRN